MFEDIRKLANIGSSVHYALGAGVHNAVTASLVERAGFDVLWLSSLEISTAKLLPDANVITFNEVSDILREIKRTTNLPIMVDADNGYGSDETAIRAAQEFCAAGATAICLEDNAFPKRNSFYVGIERHLEDIEIFCQRIKKVRQRVDPRLEIIARTEGLVAGRGAKETIERAYAYIEAGADALFVQSGKFTKEDFESVLREIKGNVPIITTPTALPEVSAERLHAMGVDIIIFSNVVIRTIIKSVSEVLSTLLYKQNFGGVQDRMLPLEDLFEITHAYDWFDIA